MRTKQLESRRSLASELSAYIVNLVVIVNVLPSLGFIFSHFQIFIINILRLTYLHFYFHMTVYFSRVTHAGAAGSHDMQKCDGTVTLEFRVLSLVIPHAVA